MALAYTSDPMPASRKVLPLARWSLVGAILLMGAALLVTGWITLAGVRDASQTLVRGQAGVFERSIRNRLNELDGEPRDQDLATILEDGASAGLSYLAVLGPTNQPIAQAGTPVGGTISLPPPTSMLPIDVPVSVGKRVRVGFRGLQRRPGSEPPDGPPHGRRYQVVLEFEPVQAERLRASAARTFRVGAVAAIALLVLALALVRWVLRREALARELERARRLASLGELSAVLAHEIRNPLASLKGNAQLLAQSLPTGEKPRAKADRVVDEAIRLENLTNDLLEFVRTGEIERRTLDPAALLTQSAGTVAPAEIQVDVAGAPASWSLDGNRMAQVLTNLLENAVQAGAPVRAKVAAEDGRLVFEVRDSGPGVPEEDRERIFEPFYTKRTRGTGLGLAVAKRVVELHAGTISVANAPEGGAIFRVALPKS